MFARFYFSAEQKLVNMQISNVFVYNNPFEPISYVKVETQIATLLEYASFSLKVDTQREHWWSGLFILKYRTEY